MESWIEHRRPDDRELVGWIALEGDDVTAVDRFGRQVWRGDDDDAYLTAEQALEDHGIGWLGDLWQLTLPDGAVRRVRIVEVTSERIRVKEDDFSDVTASLTFHDLPFPAPPELAPFAGDPGVIDGL